MERKNKITLITILLLLLSINFISIQSCKPTKHAMYKSYTKEIAIDTTYNADGSIKAIKKHYGNTRRDSYYMYTIFGLVLTLMVLVFLKKQ